MAGRQLKKEIYEENLRVLRHRHPSAYSAIACRSGMFSYPLDIFDTEMEQPNVAVKLPGNEKILFYQTGVVASQINEWDLGSHDFLICIGVGLGYLPLAACQHGDSRPNIVIIEPFEEMLDLAIRISDLTPLLSHEKLSLHVGCEVSVKAIIAQYEDRIPLGKTQVAIFGPARKMYGDRFIQVEKEVIENVRVVRNISYTAKHAGQQIFSNVMANLPSVFAGTDLGELKGRFDGFPAVCVAAGPSLDKAIPALKAIGDQALILCGDSAVHALVSAGIKPHLVVTTDMNPVNFEKMRTDLHRIKEAVLVFSIEANPDNVRSFLSDKRVAVTAKNAVLNHWLANEWGGDWKLPAMTSVSHTALFTAVALGADPIVLVGMDFAYSGGKSHARGSVFRYREDRNAMIPVEGVHGYPVLSLPQLITDRKQIENVITGSPVRVIDASLDGAFIQGTEVRSLEEVLQTQMDPNASVHSQLMAIDWSPPATSRDRIRTLERMENKAEAFCHECSQMEHRWLQFNPDGGKTTSGCDELFHRLCADTSEFEKKFISIMQIINILRHGEVQSLNRQFNRLSDIAQKMRPTQAMEEKAGIYASHFASLGRAGMRFFEQLSLQVDFVKKETRLRQFLSSNPHADGDTLETLFQLYLNHNELWQAESLMKFNDGRLADRPDAVLALCQAHADRRMWAPALNWISHCLSSGADDQRLRNFEKTIRNDIQSLLQQATASWQAGAGEESRRALIEYLSIVPDDPGALALQETMESSDRDNALMFINENLNTIGCPDPEELKGKVDVHIERQALERAVGILEGLDERLGGNAKAIREKIGDLRNGQQDYSSAAWHYAKALKIHPDNRDLQQKWQSTKDRLKGCLPNMEKPNQSNVANPDTGVVADPFKTVDECYADIHPMIERGEYPQAIDALEHLLSENVGFAPAHNDLGVLYFNEGQHEKALAHYLQAARIAPDNPVFQKNLADYYYVIQGEVDRALNIYFELLKKNPNDQELLLTLGKICVDQQRLDDALFFFKKVLQIDPEHGEARTSLDEVLNSRSPSRVPLREGEDEEKNLDAVDGSGTPNLPSKVVARDVHLYGKTYQVRIPEAEMFRIKNIFSNEEYALWETGAGVPDNPVIVDIGANVGLFALYCFAKYPGSTIYCFEPCPAARSLLEINLEGQSNATVLPYGLYNDTIRTYLNIHRRNSGENSIKFSNQNYTDAIEIQLMDAGQQLDELGLTHVNILKIDTEGCEVEILESLGDRLDQIDYVMVEYHSERDRRKIDQLLEHYLVFGANAQLPGVGTVKYIHKNRL